MNSFSERSGCIADGFVIVSSLGFREGPSLSSD